MKTTAQPAPKNPAPGFFNITLSAREIRTLHAALEAQAAREPNRHNEAWFLARGLEVDLEMQLRTNRIGVRQFLNEKEVI